ncbi:MAG: TlpA disulfide reductase family protein [Devosia sp.]
MSEPVAARPKLTPGRAALAALVIAVLAIAITLGVGNFAAPAMPCAPQAEAAHTVDAAATGALAALNGTGTGRGYADLPFADKDGKPVTLKDFAGKTLLVNFWASWCIPCRAEMPALDKLAAAQNDDSFMVLPINTGEAQPDKGKAFFAAGGWAHLPLYIDPNFAVLDRLKTTAVSLGLPTTLLLDKKGCEIGVLQGPAEWDSADGRRVIEALKSI